jgi:hypothetical protein
VNRLSEVRHPAPGLKDTDIRCVGYGNLSGPGAQSVMLDLDNDFLVYGALFALLGLVFMFHRTFSNYFSKREHRE